MLGARAPVIRSTSLLGEETAPPPKTLSSFMRDPKDRPDDVMWLEDRIPEQDFMYGPNAKSRRYRLYNRGIQPAFALEPLMYFVPAATLAQQVARGLYPPLPGVSMEKQANTENRIRESEAVQRAVESDRQKQMELFEAREG